jgi:hypothetical protein
MTRLLEWLDGWRHRVANRHDAWIESLDRREEAMAVLAEHMKVNLSSHGDDAGSDA